MIRWLVVLLFTFFAAISVASAADERCLDEVAEATGKASSIGELARANAFFTWKSVVKEKYGAAYNAWSAATERKLVCIDLMTGENKGKWECTRSARPCMKGTEHTKTEGPSCKGEAVSAYGRRQGSLARAKAEAIQGWFLTIQKTLGDEWADWDKGKTKSVDCSRKSKWQYQCIALAYPCQG